MERHKEWPTRPDLWLVAYLFRISLIEKEKRKDYNKIWVGQNPHLSLSLRNLKDAKQKLEYKLKSRITNRQNTNKQK